VEQHHCFAWGQRGLLLGREREMQRGMGRLLSLRISRMLALTPFPPSSWLIITLQVLEQKQASVGANTIMGTDHVYVIPGQEGQAKKGEKKGK
jgi:hypothetical protein